MADKEPELTDEIEGTGDELKRLKQEKKTLVRELESKATTIAELEQMVASKDTEIVTLKETIVASDGKLTEINDTLSQAIASYKNLVVESNPEILTELITGDTVDAVNESLGSARALVDRVKQGIEVEAAMTKVPVGAPQRAPLDLSVLSPREKIQYAIGGKG